MRRQGREAPANTCRPTWLFCLKSFQRLGGVGRLPCKAKPIGKAHVWSNLWLAARAGLLQCAGRSAARRRCRAAARWACRSVQGGASQASASPPSPARPSQPSPPRSPITPILSGYAPTPPSVRKLSSSLQPCCSSPVCVYGAGGGGEWVGGWVGGGRVGDAVCAPPTLDRQAGSLKGGERSPWAVRMPARLAERRQHVPSAARQPAHRKENQSPAIASQSPGPGSAPTE